MLRSTPPAVPPRRLASAVRQGYLCEPQLTSCQTSAGSDRYRFACGIFAHRACLLLLGVRMWAWWLLSHGALVSLLSAPCRGRVVAWLVRLGAPALNSCHRVQVLGSACKQHHPGFCLHLFVQLLAGVVWSLGLFAAAHPLSTLVTVLKRRGHLQVSPF